MAMTPLTWNTVTIAAPVAPPWTANTYTVPAEIVAAINAGTAITVFCIEDNGSGSTASIAYDGGTATLPSSAITVAAALTTNVQQLTDEVWYSARVGATGWYFYSSTLGSARAMTDSTALGIFIS